MFRKLRRTLRELRQPFRELSERLPEVAKLAEKAAGTPEGFGVAPGKKWFLGTGRPCLRHNPWRN